MTDFNILITQAKVSKISFEIDQESKRLDWNCQVQLCTDDNRQVTSTNLSSNAWQDTDKIKLPDSLLPIIKRLFESATPICADKIMNRFTMIEATKKGAA